MKVLILAALLAWLPSIARSQSTDGFHEIQVFPVVVDSASFSQRFSFRAISSGAGVATLHPRYYPAQGTSQPGPIDCPVFTVNFAGTTFDDLRALCPALAPGSQFGFMMIEQQGAEHLAFSGYSRVSNPAGAGFSVEAFPAHTFTAALVTAAGLRRSAASVGAPAFQSNCFVGLLGEHHDAPAATRLLAGLVGANGRDLGQPAVLDLLPGQMVRLLDVFSATGVPPGDHDRATFVVRQVLEPLDAPRPGVVAFCTLQDNTSFGADMRIAKQEYAIHPLIQALAPAAHDDHIARVTLSFANPGPGTSLPFGIDAGSGQQNTHVISFRHPDWISCELTKPHSVERLPADGGLEMRMLAWDGSGYVPLAGGSGVIGWSRIYLGDKREREDGRNTQYWIQVEEDPPGPVIFGSIDYGLRCWSGSGHSRGDMVRFHRIADDF
jgi:hypothetical protein